MPSIRIDNTLFCSLFAFFVNYATKTGTISVAATPLASGSSRTISTTITYTRGGTIADIYASNGTEKTLVSSGGRAAAAVVYNYKSTETVRFDTSYSSSSITVSLIITNNSGASITPNQQDITISVVQYDAPISSI